jgi:hypothetical protein
MARFCTYFDANYLFKGLALYRSLARHAPGSELWALCLDASSLQTLERLALPGLHPLPLAALEAAEPRLLAVKPGRSKVEYYFTCTPALLWHLLDGQARGESITYLDADLFFFASPEPLFAELRERSVAIIGHRFPSRLRALEVHGIYNVGWLTFADDGDARQCLAWWRDRCIEWCYDRVEDGKFADQRYLDDWPTRFHGVHVLANPGAGVAPWNVEAHPVTIRGGRPWVEESPLIFYHFHGFRRLASWLFDPGLAGYGARLEGALRHGVYLPYLTELRGIEQWMRLQMPDLGGGWATSRGPSPLATLGGALRGELLVAP